MELGISERSRRERRWAQVAREFAYACRSCGATPELEDLEHYLAAGLCRACGASAEVMTSSTGGHHPH